MRILLDECVDQRRMLFTGHNCQTAGYAKLAVLKNGVLLAAVTTDQGIPYQQNREARRIGILVFCAPNEPT